MHCKYVYSSLLACIKISCKEWQQHLASNSCKKGYDKQAWIDQELTSRNDCEIVFKNGVEAILEREGGYFWCPGCGLGSPFPGSMKVSIRYCCVLYAHADIAPCTGMRVHVTRTDSSQTVYARGCQATYASLGDPRSENLQSADADTYSRGRRGRGRGHGGGDGNAGVCPGTQQ